MTSYAVEIAVVALVLWEILMGLRRGLSGELFRLAGTAIILGAGLALYERFGAVIAGHSRLAHDPETARALAFLLIVVGLGIGLFVIQIFMRLLVKVKFNDAFDRPAGAAAGLFRGLLIGVLVVIAAGLWPHAAARAFLAEKSPFGRVVFKFMPAAKARMRALESRIEPARERAASELAAPKKGDPDGK